MHRSIEYLAHSTNQAVILDASNRSFTLQGTQCTSDDHLLCIRQHLVSSLLNFLKFSSTLGLFRSQPHFDKRFDTSSCSWSTESYFFACENFPSNLCRKCDHRARLRVYFFIRWKSYCRFDRWVAGHLSYHVLRNLFYLILAKDLFQTLYTWQDFQFRILKPKQLNLLCPAPLVQGPKYYNLS